MTRNRKDSTTYQLRVDGHLDQHWSTWFGYHTLTHEPDGTTSITGVMIDQAELHGLLTRIRDLGVTLLSLAVIEPSSNAPPCRVPTTEITDASPSSPIRSPKERNH